MATATINSTGLTPVVTAGTVIRRNNASQTAANRVAALQQTLVSNALQISSGAVVNFPLSTIASVASVSKINVALKYAFDTEADADGLAVTLEIVSGTSHEIGTCAAAEPETTPATYDHDFLVSWGQSDLDACYLKFSETVTDTDAEGIAFLYDCVVTVTYEPAVGGGGTSQAIFSGSAFGFGF